MIKAVISDFFNVLLLPTGKAVDEYELNTELLDFYTSLKKHINVYMFTNALIHEQPEFDDQLQPVFDEIFSAIKMGLSKKDPASYRSLANRLNLKPEEVLFIDDSVVNIEAAKTAGMNVITFTDTESVKKEFHSLSYET